MVGIEFNLPKKHFLEHIEVAKPKLSGLQAQSLQSIDQKHPKVIKMK